MSIYINDSQKNCGDIKEILKDGTEDSIKYVIYHDQVIWPNMINYEFWWSKTIDPFISCNTSYNIDAKEQDITLYIRCTDSKYSSGYKIKISDMPGWVFIEGTNNDIIINTNKNIVLDKPDAAVTLHIKGNPNAYNRNTNIVFSQLNSDNSETGMQFNLGIVQNFDYVEGNGDYTNAKIQYYSDSTFTSLAESYIGAAYKEGNTDIYFTIQGARNTVSGNSIDILFGENNETLNIDNFVLGSYIKEVSNIEYLGNGRWHASIIWNDNISKDNFTYNIDNIELGTDTVPVEGGNVDILWDIYKVYNSTERNSNISIKLDKSDKWNGSKTFDSLSISQNGGNEQEKVELTPDQISTISISGDYINSIGDISYTNKKYKCTCVYNAQNIINTYTISTKEDPIAINEFNEKSSIIDKFSIYKSTSSVDKRNCNITIKSDSLSVTKTKTFIQNGKEGSDYIEIVDQSEGTIVISSNVSWITIGNSYYNDNIWNVDLNIDSNPKNESGYTISNLKYSNNIPAGGLDGTNSSYTVQFSITSGQSNSNDRTGTIYIIYTPKDGIQVKEEQDIVQFGSNDASSTVYHDELKDTISVVYLTNNFVFGNISNHIYTYYFVVPENNEHSTTISSTSIESANIDIDSSVFEFDEDLQKYKTKFTLSAQGYPYYKGVSKNLNISITEDTYSLSQVFNTNQLAKSLIKGTSIVDCTTLDTSKLNLYIKSEYDIKPSLGEISYNQNTKQFEGIALIGEYDSNNNYILVATIDGTPYNRMIPNTANTYPIVAKWMTDTSTTDIELIIDYSGYGETSEIYTIKYTGEVEERSSIGTDIKVVSNNSFAVVNGSDLVVVKNIYESIRSTKVTFTTLTCPTELSATITITQVPAASYTYTLNIDSSSKLYIDEENQSPVAATIIVYSIRSDNNQASIKISDLTSGYTCQSITNSGNYYTITITANTTSLVSKLVTFNINQYNDDTGVIANTKAVTIQQYGYTIIAAPPKINFTKTNLNQTISVLSNKEFYDSTFSTKSTTEIGYTIKSNTTWLTVSGNEINAANPTENSRTGSVTVTQNGTNKSSIISVTEAGYSDADVSEAQLDLYVEGSSKETNTATFTSKISGVADSPSAVWKTGTFADFNINISSTNISGIYKVTVSNYDTRYAKTSISDTIVISNTGGTLCEIPVVQHGFVFSCINEEINANGTADVKSAAGSATTVTLYNTTDEGDIAEYYLSNNLSYFDINKDEYDRVIIIGKSDNSSTSETRTETLTLIQEYGGYDTGLEIDITITQDTATGSISTSDINFYYNKSVSRICSGSGTFKATVISGTSWLTVNVSGSTVTFTANGGSSSHPNKNGAYVLYGSNTSRLEGLVNIYCNGTLIGAITCYQHSYELNASNKTISPISQYISIVDSSYVDKSLSTSNWQLSGSSSWLNVSGYIALASVNTTGAVRTATISITQANSLLYKEVTITQNAYKIISGDGTSSSIHFYTSEENTKTISNIYLQTITSSGSSNSTVSFTISNTNTWISCTGTGNIISVSINWDNLSYNTNESGYKVYNGSSVLSGTITLSYNSICTYVITVYLHSFQFSVSPSSIEGPSGTIAITSTQDGSTSIKYMVLSPDNYLYPSTNTNIELNNSNITFTNTKITGNTPNSYIYLKQSTSGLKIQLTQNYGDNNWIAHNE